VSATAEDTASEALVVISDDVKVTWMVARFKASMPVIAVTSNERTFNKLNLSWGVTPVLVKKTKTFAEAVKGAKGELSKMKMVKKGDTVTILGAMDMKGEANAVIVETI